MSSNGDSKRGSGSKDAQETIGSDGDREVDTAVQYHGIDLSDIRDDIVTTVSASPPSRGGKKRVEENSSRDNVQENGFQGKYLTHVSTSQPSNKYFIQQKGHFVGVDVKEQMKQSQALADRDKRDNDQREAEENKFEAVSRIQAAVSFQSLCRRFYTYLHGLLAGLSLSQTVFVFLLTQPYWSNLDFVHHYHHLCQPIDTLFTVLLVLALLSVLERNDVIEQVECSVYAVMQLLVSVHILPIVFYLTSLALHLSQRATVNKLSLWSHHNITAALAPVSQGNITASHYHWSHTEMESDIESYKVILAVSTVLHQLSWLIIVQDVNYDRLTQYLSHKRDNYITIITRTST